MINDNNSANLVAGPDGYHHNNDGYPGIRNGRLLPIGQADQGGREIGPPRAELEIGSGLVTGSRRNRGSDLPSSSQHVSVGLQLGTLVIMWGLSIGLIGGFIYNYLIKGVA